MATEAEPVAKIVRDRRERLVDFGGALMTPRHRGDDERRAELLPKKTDASVDAVVARLRQGLMDEPHTLEKRRSLTESNLVGRAEIEVIRLSLLDVGRHSQCLLGRALPCT